MPAHRAAALIVLSAMLAAGCVPATSNIDQAQLMLDLGDAISAMREDNVVLQEQIDSLRTALARNDTLLARVAALNGLGVPTR